MSLRGIITPGTKGLEGRVMQQEPQDFFILHNRVHFNIRQDTQTQETAELNVSEVST